MTAGQLRSGETIRRVSFKVLMPLVTGGASKRVMAVARVRIPSEIYPVLQNVPLVPG